MEGCSSSVVPNLFYSRAIYFFLEGIGGHKIKFVYIPLSPTPTARGLESAVSSPAGSGAQPQPTTHLRAF